MKERVALIEVVRTAVASHLELRARAQPGSLVLSFLNLECLIIVTGSMGATLSGSAKMAHCETTQLYSRGAWCSRPVIEPSDHKLFI